MLFRHKHKFIDGIQTDGYQYCSDCGKAVVPDCIHKWEEECRMAHYYYDGIDRMDGQIIVLKCEKCGDFKNHYVQ
tara:strand:+ start:1180 stop:1404 length:225 start_codon:yes stop_codon:yes gene_type:complete